MSQTSTITKKDISFEELMSFHIILKGLFYESPDSDVAIGQDLILLAAAKLAGISTPFTEDWYRKCKWRSVIPYLRPTGTRARAVSAMANAKQKRDLSKINIKDMDTIARHSRLRGLNRKISRGERLTVAESKQQADLKTLGTAAKSIRKLREMDAKDMEILKKKIARSEVLTAMDVRQARDLDLQVAFQTLATDASSKPKRKPKRKLQDMNVKDMDKRSKTARKETLKRKITRSDALAAMDVRQARDLGIYQYLADDVRQPLCQLLVGTFKVIWAQTDNLRTQTL